MISSLKDIIKKNLIKIIKSATQSIATEDIQLLKNKLFKDAITIDNSLNIRSSPIIHKFPESKFRIGKNCTILNNSEENIAGISSPTVLATVTANADLFIGDHVGISGAYICCSDKIHIGNFVNIGIGVRIYDTDFHPIDFAERRANPGFNLSKIPHAPVYIGDDV